MLRLRKILSAVAVIGFILFFLFIRQLCYCPTYYLELSAVGVVPLLCGPFVYRWLGCGIITIGLLTASGEHDAKTQQRLKIARILVSADVHTISTQLNLYKTENGSYPTTQQGIQALNVPPQTDPKPAHWRQLFRNLPMDPWKRVYIYRCPGVRNPDGYDLFSAGPDGKPDTADDDWGDAVKTWHD